MSRSKPVAILCLTAAVAVVACGRKAGSASSAPAPDARVAVMDQTPAVRVDASPPVAMTPPTRPKPPVSTLAPGGRDFGPEVKRTFDRMFCRQGAPDGPCKRIAALVESYRKRHLQPMKKWLAPKLPADLPPTLLYPFSGGDLISALAAYPQKRLYVHLSLEHAGPPAPLAALKPGVALAARWWFMRMAKQLLTFGESFSVDLQKQEAARLPGVLPMLLIGLHVHGATPTGLRYFRLKPDGTLHYYEANAFRSKRAGKWAKRIGGNWRDPRYSKLFTHLELRFRMPGEKKDRVIRHLAADLSDKGLRRRPEYAAMIGRLGRHSLMIKAASYLLWTNYFRRIRDAAFRQARFMIADVSAPSPIWLKQQGFAIETYGAFHCVAIRKFAPLEGPWRQAFAGRPRLPFRFGYRDCRRNNVIVLGRRKVQILKPKRSK